MDKKPKVIEVKEAPQLTNPYIQQGIRDKGAAENWGVRNHHAVVYYLAKKQKVYAERQTAQSVVLTTATKAGATACST